MGRTIGPPVDTAGTADRMIRATREFEPRPDTAPSRIGSVFAPERRRVVLAQPRGEHRDMGAHMPDEPTAEQLGIQAAEMEGRRAAPVGEHADQLAQQRAGLDRHAGRWHRQTREARERCSVGSKPAAAQDCQTSGYGGSQRSQQRRVPLCYISFDHGQHRPCRSAVAWLSQSRREMTKRGGRDRCACVQHQIAQPHRDRARLNPGPRRSLASRAPAPPRPTMRELRSRAS
jgi:hypothetical protein